MKKIEVYKYEAGHGFFSSSNSFSRILSSVIFFCCFFSHPKKIIYVLYFNHHIMSCMFLLDSSLLFKTIFWIYPTVFFRYFKCYIYKMKPCLFFNILCLIWWHLCTSVFHAKNLKCMIYLSISLPFHMFNCSSNPVNFYLLNLPWIWYFISIFIATVSVQLHFISYLGYYNHLTHLSLLFLFLQIQPL